MINERTALLLSPTATDQQQQQHQPRNENDNNNNTATTHGTTKDDDYRITIYKLIEGISYSGQLYNNCMIVLIVINVIAFIIGTIFIDQYNDPTIVQLCSMTCDKWLFGNYKENGLSQLLHIDTSTSILELVTISIFTIDYMLRLWTADLIHITSSNNSSSTTPTTIKTNPYSGWYGRMYWMISFFSIVDLISIVPFYIDAFILKGIDFTIGTSFVRMFRLVRIIHMNGRYNVAITMFYDVYQLQKSIFYTALFIGITTWILVSSLYYITERLNPNFIYCPACNPDNDNDVDAVSTCSIDPIYGFVSCNTTAATSSSNCTSIVPCTHLYESIPSASYYALLNLFGEYPHITDHSTYGKIVATITSVIAVAVFALPVGIIGTGFETVIMKQRQQQQRSKEKEANAEQQQQQGEDEEMTSLIPDQDNANNNNKSIKKTKDNVLTPNYIGNPLTVRGQLYNLLHAQTTYTAKVLDMFINFLIISTALMFIIDTTITNSSNDNSNDNDSNDTNNDNNIWQQFDTFYEFVAVVVFTIEYILRVYAAGEDPKYNGTSRNGTNTRFQYMTTFLAIVDVFSFVPYWIQQIVVLSISSTTSSSSSSISNNTMVSMFVSSLRLLRILRFEKYTHAFTTFDDVFVMYYDVLAITAYTAILFWIFFSILLYLTERNSYNIEMSTLYYNTVPNAMWITLLNLSGESPLSEYTMGGKIITAIVGIFATSIFSIPIGILGVGFEQIVQEENQDAVIEVLVEEEVATSEQQQQQDDRTSYSSVFVPIQERQVISSIEYMQLVSNTTTASTTDGNDTTFGQEQSRTIPNVATTSGFADTSYIVSTTAQSYEIFCYNFVNGLGSVMAQQFEITIYICIFVAVTVGCIQTIDGYENTFNEIEWFSIIVFTIEYILRFIGVGADPLYNTNNTNTDNTTTTTANGNNNNPNNSIFVIPKHIQFVFSFYSIVDLLAIVPFYLSIVLPNSIVNQYDEYLRMIRIIRLVKLDKYVPSLTLVDDVLRLKFQSLTVAFYAACTLWILFGAALFLCEHTDTSNGIDNVPLYGCNEDCNMSDRFQNMLDSLYYTGIHLTGDYPIITYNWYGRIVNVFMVLAAVGVVSVPSGLIASGFIEIIQQRTKAAAAQAANSSTNMAILEKQRAGDDWYEIQYRLLEGTEPNIGQQSGQQQQHWTMIDRMQIAVNEFLNGKPKQITSTTTTTTTTPSNIPTGTTTTSINNNATTGTTTTTITVTEWTVLSKSFRIFMLLLIVSNIVAVLLESIPSIDYYVGNERYNFFDVFEFVSVLLFTIEYILRLFCASKNREALYSPYVYATTFFGLVDFVSTVPWYIEQVLLYTHVIDSNSDTTKVFRIIRMFRIFQLEDFLVAFRKLDNVYRASKDVLKATGLLALIIWVGCSALFFIFEENNPNWRTCDSSVPLYNTTITTTTEKEVIVPGCYDFHTTKECNAMYPGMCTQQAFTNMPNTLYYTAIFLGGEWGVVDFTWPGRLVAIFLCIVGIGLYAIPIGTLFNSFGEVLGLAESEDDDEEEEKKEDDNNIDQMNLQPENKEKEE